MNLSPFHYTRNNPINRFDPDGKQDFSYVLRYVFANDPGTKRYYEAIERGELGDVIRDDLYTATITGLDDISNVSSRISDVSLKLALASLVIPGVGEGVAGTLITISGWAEIAGASASTLKFFITLSVEDRQTFVIDVSAVAISKYIERKLKLNPKLSERVKLALIALISASVNKTKGVVTMILNEKKNEKYEKDESNDRYVAPADNTRVDWWWQGWGAQYQGSPR